MTDRIIEDLREAVTDAQKNWVITRAMLATMPPPIAETVLAAAVSHWFDAEVLGALLAVDIAEAGSQYQTLYRN